MLPWHKPRRQHQTDSDCAGCSCTHAVQPQQRKPAGDECQTESRAKESRGKRNTHLHGQELVSHPLHTPPNPPTPPLTASRPTIRCVAEGGRTLLQEAILIVEDSRFLSVRRNHRRAVPIPVVTVARQHRPVYAHPRQTPSGVVSVLPRCSLTIVPRSGAVRVCRHSVGASRSTRYRVERPMAVVMVTVRSSEFPEDSRSTLPSAGWAS